MCHSHQKICSLRISQVLLGGPLGKLGDPNFQSECPMDYWGITRDPPGDPKQDAHTRHLAISGQTLPGQPGNFPYPINVFSNYNPGFFCSTWARISNQANIFLKHTVCIFVEVRAGMICCKHLVCFLCWCLCVAFLLNKNSFCYLWRLRGYVTQCLS